MKEVSRMMLSGKKKKDVESNFLLFESELALASQVKPVRYRRGNAM